MRRAATRQQITMAMRQMQGLVADAVVQSARDPQFVSGKLMFMGVFRGFVEDVCDPEQRGRMRVRIPQINHETPTAFLPWAERSFPDAGHNAGDFIPLKAGNDAADGHTGDPVWVMFEDCDPHKPVVLGCWYAMPGRISEAPAQSRAPRYHNRRRVIRSRHGTTIEIGDDPSDFEVKINMPGGTKVHIRESDGGRGFHVNTAGGHIFSLQDEHPGQSSSPPVTAYDTTEDHTFLPGPVGSSASVLAGQTDQIVPFNPARSPDGVVRSLTPGAATGFGQQGVQIRTLSGHTLELRDVTNPGFKVVTKDGHKIETLDDGGTVTLQTGDGLTTVRLTQGSGILVSAPGQTLTFNAATMVFNAATQFTINTPSFDIFP